MFSLYEWMVNRTAKCHGYYTVGVHLNQPDQEYSLGNGVVSKAISLGWISVKYVFDLGTTSMVYNLLLKSSGFLSVSKSFSISTSFSRKIPSAAETITSLNYPLNAG